MIEQPGDGFLPSIVVPEPMLKTILRRMIPSRGRAVLRRVLLAAFNLRASARITWHVGFMNNPLRELTQFEKTIFSQNGEDGILEAIFRRIGTTNKIFVEFGVEDGTMCNTRALKAQGWTGLQMDSRTPPGHGVQREFVTAENIELLLEKYRLPFKFDVLSIDVDGNDFWIWKALTQWRPRVVVIEYNAAVPFHQEITIRYDPAFIWDGSDYFGSGLAALIKLGCLKGYTLVCCDSRGVNAVFIDDSLVEPGFDPLPLEDLFRRSTNFHPHSRRGDWVTV